MQSARNSVSDYKLLVIPLTQSHLDPPQSLDCGFRFAIRSYSCQKIFTLAGLIRTDKLLKLNPNIERIFQCISEHLHHCYSSSWKWRGSLRWCSF